MAERDNINNRKMAVGAWKKGDGGGRGGRDGGGGGRRREEKERGKLQTAIYKRSIHHCVIQDVSRVSGNPKVNEGSQREMAAT